MPPGRKRGGASTEGVGADGRGAFRLVVPGRLEELQEGDELETRSDVGALPVLGRVLANANPVHDDTSPDS